VYSPCNGRKAADDSETIASQNVPEIAWFLWMRMQLEQQDSEYVAQEYQVQLTPQT